MINLNAGPFQISYENGFLRQIKHNGFEVVRMIYFALRDHNWGTFSQTIENEVIDNQDDSFSISYTCFNINEQSIPVLAWDVKIEGQKDGTISFEIQGIVLQDIRKNRAGFCVLHPVVGVAEQPVTIFHEDSTATNTHFPRYIAAVDPFLNIRNMRWKSANNAMYQFDFEGDVFQTEDQRNWGDASYKTFCTPLSLPFPVLLQQNTTIKQRVTLRVFSSLILDEKPTTPFQKTLESAPLQPFELGIAASIETNTLSNTAIVNLKKLDLQHYRIDIIPLETDWISTFSNHCENASMLDLPLEIALFLGNDYARELQEFVLLCQQNRLIIKNLLLFSKQSLTTPPMLIELIPTLKQQLPKVKIGVGTDHNFTELNRHRFEVGEADFVSFSFHPQAHAFDDLSLMENTETLRYQVESAENIYHLPVHVSFISLHKRANPYATHAADFNIALKKQIDSRQKTGFGAAWVQSVLAHLSQTPVMSVTIFRTTGELGIMSAEGAVYPVFEVLKKYDGA